MPLFPRADRPACPSAPSSLCRRLCALSGAALSLAAAAQEPPTATLPPVEVIGTSPLPGQGIDRNLLPYATQLIRRERIDEAKSDNLLDFMSRHLAGVQINDIQGSLYQGDLTYRGFRASPLLGASQGLSVYLDGVRINEPFGDVVNWDLLPEFSVRSLAIVPGANPSFGLNTLGGALAFTTESGLTAPGLRGELSAGSFGRKQVDLAYGRAYGNGYHGYIAGSWFDEQGWRDDSAGHLGNLLTKFGRSTERTDWALSLLIGQSTLVGNGLVPAYTIEGGVRRPDLYAHDRAAVYTYPDQTHNRVAQLGFNLRHDLDARTTLDALAYVRRSTRSTVNGDEADEPEGADNAAFNTTRTQQMGYGAAASLSGKHGAHQWQIGTTLDASRTHYEQYEQPGRFTPDRGVLPGATPRELSARVAGRSLAFGLFGSDTLELAPRTHVTATARFNQAQVRNQLTTADDDSGTPDRQPEESFTYRSLNPALGITHRLDGGPTLYANLARNNRVPTVIELGCADPEQPCRLPAGLQADPYLAQVISHTAEIGMRWPLGRGVSFEASAYRTDNRDDILFSSTSINGQLGFFRNFPKTRYQGLELQAQAAVGPVQLALSYGLLDATYQADGVLRMGERNVSVAPGTRLAGVPRQTLKLSADWHMLPGLSLGGDLQAYTRRVTSGNEDGRVSDDDGAPMDVSLPGYALVNLRASYRCGTAAQRGSGATGDASGWEVFAKVNNVFDRRYETYAAVAATQFSPTGAYTGEDTDAVSVAPGAPRSFSVGLRWRF